VLQFAVGVFAALAAVTATPAFAAGLLIADGGFGGVLDIKEQDVKVTINNGVAVTEVDQIFLNKENRIVEALYTFPVPRGASVANFSMWINGKEMIGEVVEKERARQIYESYKQQKRDPGLLEQVDYKRFEMRIFPIAAGAEQRVKITYYQELDFDHDEATYIYPLATAARRDAQQRTTGKFALTLDVKSEVPIERMESPSHAAQFVIAKHSPNYCQASLETTAGDLSRDVVLEFKTQRPRTGIDVIASKQSGEDGYFLLTLTAGKELEELNRGMDYVFILDVSGSMANDGKLGLSRQSVGAFINALGPDDRFEIMTFNVAVNSLFHRLSPVNEEATGAARSFVESQQARGGTVLRPALSAAYRYQDSDRTLNVVVLSDGMTEQREQQELLSLIRERPSGARVFCIGVGNEVNRPLLQQLAEGAGGLAAFVSQESSFERQAQAFRRKLLRPAATSVRLSFGGPSVYDVEPQQLPNLYHGAPLRVYGRYRNSGPLAVKLEADVLGAPLNQTVDLTLPAQENGNPEIERMWAAHRVERLMAADRAAGPASTSKDEIVRLCEGYSITSEYASFIVLENDAEYQRWSIQRRNATRVSRDRNAQVALRRDLDRMRDAAVANMRPDKSDGQRPAVRAGVEPTRFSTSVPNPSVTPSAPTNSMPPLPAESPRSRDIATPSFSGGGGGGGAIDPVSAAIALGLAGASLAAGRYGRRKQ
jgi:Ca-activated chloride channel family protein